jgi:hypothetical protein
LNSPTVACSSDVGGPLLAHSAAFGAETVLPMRDGLPKQKDLPKELGGSGTLVQE